MSPIRIRPNHLKCAQCGKTRIFLAAKILREINFDAKNATLKALKN